MDEADFAGSKAALDEIRGLGSQLTRQRLLAALKNQPEPSDGWSYAGGAFPPLGAHCDLSCLPPGREPRRPVSRSPGDR